MGISVADTELLALQQLAARYWARADGDSSQSLAAIFATNGQLILGSLALDGLKAIELFFIERDASQLTSRRTTRHVACNHLVTALEGGCMRMRSTVLVYAGTGDWPMESAAPSAIADFEDICEHGAQGWRFLRREARTVFIGPGAAKFAR